MTDRSSSEPDRAGRSPALVRAISTDVISCPADRPVVSADELDELRSILGERRSDSRVDRARVVRTLARSDPSAATAAAIARVAANDDESAGVRITAAAALGTLPPEIAEAHLVDLLEVPEDRVRTQVVKQLGWVGTQRSLEALERHEFANKRSERRALTARLAIAHRANVSVEEIDRIREQLGLRWETVASKALQRTEAEILVSALGPRRGLTLASNAGLEFACGTERNVVLLSAELAESDLVEALLAKSMNAGVVAVDDHGGSQLSVRFRLLTNPRGDALEIMAVTSVGEPAFVGTGERSEGGLIFQLRDVNELVPMEINGTITPRSVELELRVREGSTPRAAGAGIPVTG